MQRSTAANWRQCSCISRGRFAYKRTSCTSPPPFSASPSVTSAAHGGPPSAHQSIAPGSHGRGRRAPRHGAHGVVASRDGRRLCQSPTRTLQTVSQSVVECSADRREQLSAANWQSVGSTPFTRRAWLMGDWWLRCRWTTGHERMHPPCPRRSAARV